MIENVAALIHSLQALRRSKNRFAKAPRLLLPVLLAVTIVAGETVGIFSLTNSSPYVIIHGAVMPASSPLPDFAIMVNPNNITVGQDVGPNVNVTISLKSLNNFAGTVGISSSRPSGVTTGPGDKSLNLLANGTAATKLYYDTAFVPAGVYDVVITGTSGQYNHTTTLIVTVHYSEFDFTVAGNYFQVPLGSTGFGTTVMIKGTSKFSGSATVNLSIASVQPQIPSLSYSFNPSTLPTPSYNITENSFLSLTFSAYTQPGLYTITLLAIVSGTFFPHYVTFPLAIGTNTTIYHPALKANDWAKYDNLYSTWYTSNPNIAPVSPLAYYQNAYSVRLAIIQTSGSIVNANKTTSYLNMTTDTQQNSGSILDANQPLFPWIIASNLNGSRFNRTITSQYAGAMRQVNILDLAFNGNYSHVQAVWTWDAATGLLVEQDWKITASGPGGTIYGTLHIRISDTNIWPIQAPEFTVTLPAVTLAIRPGGNIIVTVTSLNGYNDSIYISANVLPEGTIIPNGFNPNSTRLTPNLSTTFTMTPTIPASGTLHLLISAAGGGTVHRVLVKVIPFDLTYTMLPQDLQAVVGDTAQTAIIVNSPNSLRIPVRISIQQTPTGLTTSISNPELNGPGLSTITIQASTIGTYTFNVSMDTATTHDIISVTVRAVDFRIDPLPPVLVLSPPGSSFTARVQLKPFNGFSKRVTLTAVTSTGLTVNVTPDQIIGRGNFTLTLNPTQTGNYTITLTATSGSASHNAVMKVQVLPSSPAAFLALPSYGSILVLGIIAGLIIAVASVLTLLFFRKRQRPVSGLSSEPTLLTKPT